MITLVLDNKFEGQISDLQNKIDEVSNNGVDLSAYSKTDEINHAINAAKQSANEYTDNKISNIPPIDLSDYLNTEQVNDAINDAKQECKQYTDTKINAIPANDLSMYSTTSEMNAAISQSTISGIATANEYTDDAIEPISEALPNLATRDEMITNDTQIMSTLTTGDNNLNIKIDDHIDGDEVRWQADADAKVKMIADLKEWTKKQIAGTNPQYNYESPTVVIGSGGLINILDLASNWTVPANGAIICSYSGLPVALTSVNIDGEPVWSVPLLGIGAINPSDEIPVTPGQVISLSTLLSVGFKISVSYYPIIGS